MNIRENKREIDHNNNIYHLYLQHQNIQLLHQWH